MPETVLVGATVQNTGRGGHGATGMLDVPQHAYMLGGQHSVWAPLHGGQQVCSAALGQQGRADVNERQTGG